MWSESNPKLTLSLLVITGLCLEASVINRVMYLTPVKRTWTEARSYCQRFYIDLITPETTRAGHLGRWLKSENVSKAWIGVHRDPQKHSEWKIVNIQTGVGLSEYDWSASSQWAVGQPSGHCAFIGDDQKWYSDQCSSEHEAICLERNKIVHYKEKLSWHSASEFCQARHGSLATITENTQYLGSGWIGLNQQDGLHWDWISDVRSNYRNWAPGEPLTADCGTINSTSHLWDAKMCSENFRFVCSSDNLVLVKENKTWEEAMNYCKSFCPHQPCSQSYSLLSLPNLDEHSYARKRIYKATTNEVWVGLRFLGGSWWWESGDEVEDEGMLPKCPPRLSHCRVLSKYDTNKWITRDCSERRNFICYRVKETVFE